MTVFVVVGSYDYSHAEILGVYATPEGAQAKVAALVVEVAEGATEADGVYRQCQDDPPKRYRIATSHDEISLQQHEVHP